jgi:hypothetical protein
LFPDVAKEWHPIKNGDLTPDDVIGKSHKKAYWQCPKDDAHVWDAVISSRTGQKTGCPYCANQRVSVTNNLQARFPEIAKQWHPTKNGDKKPEMFTGISGSYAWWICHKGPDHEWRAQIAKRTSPAAGRGCPCCAGYKLSVTNRLDLNDKAVAEEWHPTKNGELKPNDVVLGSNKNVWWLCSKCGYEWRATVNHRAYGGTDCAECTLTGVSKKEIRVAFEIYKIFGLEYIRRPTIKFGSKQLRPDILIEEQNLVVEYDGARYHKDRESFDQKKTDALQKAGWKVIRVRETPLEMITENDISVRPQEYNKSVAGKVLQQIEKVCGISIPGLDDYLKGDRPINKQAADEHIATLLRDKQQTTLVENS